MSISASSLKFYKSVTVNNTTSNGGRKGYVSVTSGQATNVFPNVTQDERIAGLTRYRKLFAKTEDSGSETLYNMKVFISKQTPATLEYIQIKAGTNTDTQADADDYTGWLGCGRLNEVISAIDTTSFDVLFETGSGISIGDKAWLSDGTNSEYLTVSNVEWLSSTATVTTTTGTIYTYAAYDSDAPVWFSGYIDHGDTTSSVDNIAGDKTFSETGITTSNMGCTEDSWTGVIEASGTTYLLNCTNGTITATDSQGGVFASSSFYDDLGRLMFTISDSFFDDTWENGDEFTFDTHHACKAVWIKEVVTAQAGSYSNNNPTLRIAGESA